MRSYALRLLRDQSGAAWIIPAIGLALGIFGSRKKKKEARRAQKEAIAYQQRMVELQHEQDLEALKLTKEQNEQRIEILKAQTALTEAQQFQKGPISGPYFQVVKGR